MPTIKEATEARIREAPMRIAEEARTTLDNLPALRAANGKSEAAKEARRMAARCFTEIADLCLDDETLPPPPDLPASASDQENLSAVVAWGARSARNGNKNSKHGKQEQQKRTPKKPPEHYMLAYQTKLLIPKYTQQQIGDYVTKQLKLNPRMKQWAVSAALKSVGKYNKALGMPDPINEEKKKKKKEKRNRRRTVPVDPAELDRMSSDHRRQS